ncbi:hypothetical protein DN444_01515 [Lactobacillus reuteri]|uniref:SGNH/GDSL hydrolase family protein n=1 Tax=Limosilactobacillus reuteri TaxID=1598 RepID=UPI00128D59B8|nr:SGNH/GDSL hydrolase family protein [Limosilactobacillus reuteri]MQB88629.1 hypothetical protein [Limosilactobacillus reuteri]
MQTQQVILDVLKPTGTIADLSDSFNARVGDKMTPFQLFILEGGVAKDLKGMHPELEAVVGNGALKGNKAIMNAGAKGVHWVGSTNNVTGYNQLTLAFPAEVFPQSGFCYGHLILANEAGVRESSVDIWFQVLDGTPQMGMVADHYDSELALELAKAKNMNDQFSQEMRAAYNQQVTDAQNALTKATANLNSLAGTAGDIEAEIKANDIATKTELANTQRSITTTLSQVAINPEAFDTLASLQKAYPNGKSGLFLVAENDHKYMYVNHTWKDCGPFVGAGLLDKSVNVNKLSQVLQDSLVPTVEEIPITGQWGGYVSIQTGHNVDNDETYYSDAIPVTPGEVYIVNGTTYFDARTVILWDAKENIIGYFPQSLTDKELDSKQAFMFAIPQGAVTMYINTKKGNGNERHLYKIKSFNRVEQATSDFVASVVNGKQAKYQTIKLTKCNNDGYWQYQYGYYQDDPTGANKVVGYKQISVKPFEAYRIKGNSYFEANLYNLYDYAGRLIKTFPNSSAENQYYDKTFTVPYNGAFLKVNQYKDGPDVSLQKVTEWHDKSMIADKKWVAIGDSWTAAGTLGNGVNNYTNYVADRLGVTMVNAAIGGTGYVAQNGQYGDQFFNRQIPADGDAYTILGSFNDVFVDDFKFGDVGDVDKLSLWGGMKATLDHIWSIKDNAVVGIIAPGPWGAFNPQNGNNWDKLNLKASEVGEQYVATMKKFADYYSLPFLDLYHQSGLRPWDPNFIAKYYHGTSNTDNTHPNTNGHKIFAPKIAEFVNKLL